MCTIILTAIVNGGIKLLMILKYKDHNVFKIYRLNFKTKYRDSIAKIEKIRKLMTSFTFFYNHLTRFIGYSHYYKSKNF